MAIPDNFSELYKTITLFELLSILDNPEDYQPRAVEAAKEELSRRQLPDSKIEETRQRIITRKERAEKFKARTSVVETKIKTAGNTLIDTINPIQTGLPTTEKTIRFITIVFALYFLYQFITEIKEYWIIADISEYPIEVGLYFLPR